VEEVKLLLILLMVATEAISFQGSSSFQTYSSRDDWSVPAPELSLLAEGCGFQSKQATAIYGTRYNDVWKARKNLKNAGDDAETDLYQTLEIWKTPSGNRLVAKWDISADTVDEDELLICTSSQNHIRALVSTHTRTNPGTGKQVWRFTRHIDYAESGAVTRQESGFVKANGKIDSTPRVDAEDINALKAKVNIADVLTMLRDAEAQIRK
jgi:hypothetical protein